MTLPGSSRKTIVGPIEVPASLEPQREPPPPPRPDTDPDRQQRNVLRALYTAQERARDEDGRPTFPELFEHDNGGHPVVHEHGDYVPDCLPRRELPPPPDFHALRHTAAMDCEEAEEARELLRHKNSDVTRIVYRAHFGDRPRELLRARMEARHRSSAAGLPSADRAGGEVVPLDRAS
jgi:hypothetical protein